MSFSFYTFEFINTTGGRTNTPAALRNACDVIFTANNGDRSGVPNILVFITDGGSADRSATFQEAVKAHEKDITVIVIGLNARGAEDMNELWGIASDPNPLNTYLPNDDHQLESLKDTLVKTIHNGKRHISISTINENPIRVATGQGKVREIQGQGKFRKF